MALMHNCFQSCPSRNFSKDLFAAVVSLRGQTVHWIGTQFCVGRFLDYRDKYLNMFQNVNSFHFLQDLRGFRVHILVT